MSIRNPVGKPADHVASITPTMRSARYPTSSATLLNFAELTRDACLLFIYILEETDEMQ